MSVTPAELGRMVKEFRRIHPSFTESRDAEAMPLVERAFIPHLALLRIDF